MSKQSVRPTIQATSPVSATTRRPSVAPNAHSVADHACLLKPVIRPPMAVLEVLDDGLDTGEIYRLRQDCTIVGRSESDISIAHDDQISGQHCSVLRQRKNDGYEWILRNLQSTNGTFLRVARCTLTSSTPVMIGCYRYFFRSADAGVVTSAKSSDGTRGWQIPDLKQLSAITSSLVRLHPDGTQTMFAVPSGTSTLGSHSSCDLVLDGDPAVSDRHARVRCSDDRLFIEDMNSRNGIWAAVQQRRLKSGATFLIGEQRVRFRVL